MCPITAALALCGLVACERRSVPAVGDAATTGAPIVTSEQVVGDASMTSAALPVQEEPSPVTPEPTMEAAHDAGVTEAAKTDAGALPRWVPRDASLSIIASGDRDRNLGIVKAPPAPTPGKLTVDAGGVAVEIEIVPR